MITVPVRAMSLWTQTWGSGHSMILINSHHWVGSLHMWRLNVHMYKDFKVLIESQVPKCDLKLESVIKYCNFILSAWLSGIRSLQTMCCCEMSAAVRKQSHHQPKLLWTHSLYHKVTVVPCYLRVLNLNQFGSEFTFSWMTQLTTADDLPSLLLFEYCFSATSEANKVWMSAATSPEMLHLLLTYIFWGESTLLR